MVSSHLPDLDHAREPLEEGGQSGPPLAAELIAVIVAVTRDSPRILTLERGLSLPAGPLETTHRSLQAGVRSWVERKTHHKLGHIEQLYTFADRDRLEDPEPRQVISVSYLGLTLEARSEDPGVDWQGWYRYFPWEDHRLGPPQPLEPILEALEAWARSGGAAEVRRARLNRIHHTFGTGDAHWNEEWILQRYELLYEAGLVEESLRREGKRHPPVRHLLTGEGMQHDHRRILATGIARLRAKIKYRPVVFELLPEAFTYLQLQKAVEALAGRRVHKQNFRRLIAFQQLVEPTGGIESQTGGRPARLYRFRRSVLQERMMVGSKLPLAK